MYHIWYCLYCYTYESMVIFQNNCMIPMQKSTPKMTRAVLKGIKIRISVLGLTKIYELLVASIRLYSVWTGQSTVLIMYLLFPSSCH